MEPVIRNQLRAFGKALGVVMAADLADAIVVAFVAAAGYFAYSVVTSFIASIGMTFRIP